jgi:hypothetical protein
MRGSRWLAIPLLAAVTVTGCQSGPSRRTLASSEPAMSPSVDGGATVVEANPPRSMTFVDRHPLLSKPRQYFESSGDNKIVKSAAAVVVGIPAGIIGELKQIVDGTTPAPRY